MTTESNVVIDGYALPADLYREARTQAVATGKVQAVGILYDAPPKPAPAQFDMLSFASELCGASGFLADLRVGRHCRYLMGCTRDELRGCGCAVILYISPRAEAC